MVWGFAEYVKRATIPPQWTLYLDTDGQCVQLGGAGVAPYVGPPTVAQLGTARTALWSTSLCSGLSVAEHCVVISDDAYLLPLLLLQVGRLHSTVYLWRK